jgi:histidine triad (HIT) family protein
MSCLFCRIVAGEVPATVVHDGARTLGFRDLNPQAPTHVLVIPKDHYANAAELAEADPAYAGEVLAAAAAVAQQEGLTGGYRLVTNTGGDAGQSVDHLHIHVLGGRSLSWPPG